MCRRIAGPNGVKAQREDSRKEYNNQLIPNYGKLKAFE
jgi:hypothetical protein